jgi:O-antigen ligase
LVLALTPIVLIALLMLAVPEKYVASRSADLPGYQGGAPGLDMEAGSGRGLLWRGMLTIQSRSTVLEWLTGHGLESVLRDLPKVTGLRVGGHNSYLEVVYQLGVVGLLILAGLIGANLRGLKSTSNESPDASRCGMYWHDYYIAYLLSTIMFNGFIWDVGATWFTNLGLGYAQARVRSAQRTDGSGNARARVDQRGSSSLEVADKRSPDSRGLRK